MQDRRTKMKITNEWIYIDLTRRQAQHMGAVWNNRYNMYRLPNTLGVLREIYNMQYDNSIRKHLEEYGIKKSAQRMKLLKLKSLEDVAGDEQLRPYQRVDVNYLMQIGSAGIFNEQRTGKTPTSLILAEQKGFESIIVVCPASLVLNWKEEIEKWTKYSTIPVLGSKPKRTDYYGHWLTSKGVLIISYETLRNDLQTLILMLTQSKRKLDGLIVDEAHRLRSLIKGKNASKAARAVIQLGKHAG